MFSLAVSYPTSAHQHTVFIINAQQNREAVDALYQDIVAQDDYRAEQAVVKLLELFKAYERTVALYAELRSYYPVAAARVEDQLPPLSEIARHGSSSWEGMQ